MKIILPVIENGFQKQVARSFHNTELACIYNCTNQTVEWVSTKDVGAKSGDLAEELRCIGIRAVISTQMPLMALGFFVESGLSVYRAASESIEENILLFTANQLEPMTPILASVSSACSGSCSACKTTCNS